MLKLELFDEAFDPDRFPSYELAIQVSLNGFSFCIRDSVRGCFIGLVCEPHPSPPADDDGWRPAIRHMLSRFEWFGKPFLRSTLCFQPAPFTVVPGEYFDPPRAKQLLDLAHAPRPMDEVHFTRLDSGEVCIFGVPSMLAGDWLRASPSTRLLAPCQPVMAYGQLAPTQLPHSAALVFMGQEAILAVRNGHRLLHCGPLPNQHPEDCAYHLLSICTGLDLAPASLQVHLATGRDGAEPMGSALARFFGRVTPYRSPGAFHYSYLLARHKHQFAPLFMQALCE